MQIEFINNHFIIHPFLLEKMNKIYPTFNDEILKMEMWYIANPKKRKKNHGRFIVNWMNKIRTEKVKTRNWKDESEFKKKMEEAEKESAPPPEEWRNMMEKLKFNHEI